jgi:hypothetical protein
MERKSFETLLTLNEFIVNQSPEKTKNDEFDSIRFDTLNLNDTTSTNSNNIIKSNSISPIKQENLEISEHHLHEENKLPFKFNPPLYIQRYDYVSDLLKTYKCKTFLDIGAAECKMLRYLKNTSSDLNMIIGLDVDESVLFNAKEKFAVSWFDYIQPKDQPIEVYLIRGDISQPSEYFLNQICSTNMDLDFISLVELIEHLYPEVLIKCIETIFAKIKPKFVLITTPNQEFNVAFQDDDPKKFRHWDHKFEWTRNEFQTWCHEIVYNFTDYELVYFDGLGEPPQEFSSVGHCSQIVLFKRKTTENDSENKKNYQDYFTQLKRANYINRQQAKNAAAITDTEQKIEILPYFDPHMLNIENEYSLVSFTRYPFESFEFENIETRNQAIINEISYLINFLSRPNHIKNENNDENELTEEQIEKISNDIDIYDEKIRIASLEKIFSFSNIQKFKITNDDLIRLMIEYGFQFTNSGKYVYQYLTDDESDYHESDRSSYDTNSYDNQDWKNSQQAAANADAAENWDDEVITSPIKTKFDEENWDEEMLNSSNLKNSSMLDESLNKSFNNNDDNNNNQETYKQFTLRDQFEDIEENSNPSIDYAAAIEAKFGKINNESPNKLNISSQNETSIENLDSSNFEINYRANQAVTLSLKFKKTRRKYRKEFREKSFDLRIVPSQFDLSLD